MCLSGLATPALAGWRPQPRAETIESMKFKETQIYGWDEEPVDERPSEFSSTTGYSGLSGYQPLNAPVRTRQSRNRVGFKAVLLFCAFVLALGAFAIVKLVPLLRG